MMILSRAAATCGSISLLVLVAALASCNPERTQANDVARDNAERQALIDAMKHHPALNGDQNATGKPIDVPTTVPPKAPESSGHHDHHDQPAPKPQS